MSKRIDHIIEVYKTWSDMVVNRIEELEVIDIEVAKELVNKACQAVADKEKINITTVISQSTRELGITFDEFRQLIIEHSISKDKRHSNFANKLRECLCDNDNVDNVIDSIVD